MPSRNASTASREDFPSNPLTASELQAILQSIPGNYLILEPDFPQFTIVAVSDAYAAATNTVREQILGKGLFEVFPDNPDDPQATGIRNLTASLTSVLENKRPHRMAIQKYDIPHPEGGPFEERYWSPLNCPVLGANGKVAHIVHSVVDVTQTIKLEEREQAAVNELGAERKRLYDLFMQAPAAVMILSGPDHIVELANPMTLKLLGLPIEDFVGKPAFDAFPEARGQGFEALIESVYKTGESFVGEEQRMRLDRGGEENTGGDYFTFVLVPVRGTRQEIDRVMVFAYEVTAQVLARERTAALARQKDEFLGIVSHELRTPVTSAKAFAQVLRNRFVKVGDETSAALLSKMDGQLNKLRDLIADLLDMTRLETGKLHFNEELFDFSDLVSEVVEEMQRTTERHSIVCLTPKPVTLLGDRDRIGQVLTNFLSNAIKYSPEADKILVTTTSTPQAVTACVQDFGIGITRDMQEHIFERFHQVDGKAFGTYPGIGLGLYISSEIVKRQQGRIWVQSEPGQGATFCFELSLERDRTAMASTHQERAE